MEFTKDVKDNTKDVKDEVVMLKSSENKDMYHTVNIRMGKIVTKLIPAIKSQTRIARRKRKSIT